MGSQSGVGGPADWTGKDPASNMFMPDLSDVGPPAKGPGLPERIPEALPPPVKVRIEHAPNCQMTGDLTEAILAAIPEAEIETLEGGEEDFEVEINGKLFFSKRQLGHYPVKDEIVEITKWGNKGKSFLHLYLCSVAEGGEPKMVITDRKNTPLPKRIIMSCVIS